MRNQFTFVTLMGALAAAGASSHLQAAMSVSVVGSMPSPTYVSEILTWEARVEGADPGTLWYRFRVGGPGQGLRVVRDFAPVPSLMWTAGEGEGTYEIEVSVQNVETGEIAVASAQQEVLPAILGNAPEIFQTHHPQVFLYSAPACPAGSQMSVRLESEEDRIVVPAKQCVEGRTMNFYLAGLRPGIEYQVRHTVTSETASADGPALTLSSPEIWLPVADITVKQPARGHSPEGLLLFSANSQMTIATDLDGRSVWYYGEAISSLTRPAEGGRFFGVIQDPAADPSWQILREFDLLGMTTRETNAARVNQQLAALGRRKITSFHHEAGPLPDGKILALAATEQILTGVQGPGEVNVIGDMILVLDSDLQVVWAWDAFDHLDARRMATMGSVCRPTGGGCPPFYLTPTANDWLHSNSVQRTPDGNLVVSIRHQDWVIKIDYADGLGSGQVLWRLGKDGDFQTDSNDPAPWFSHQHDASILPGETPLLTVYDNGNIRYRDDPETRSRGQVWRLDEGNRTASLVLNADLGGYSRALGSAQRLSNGHYHFNSGTVAPRNAGQSIEVDNTGKIVYAIEVATPIYRSFRLKSLYNP